MRYNGTNFNEEAVLKRDEQAFVAWAKPKYPHFSDLDLVNVHKESTSQKALRETEKPTKEQIKAQAAKKN